MTPIDVHQGDDRPSLYLHICDQDAGTWVDLSDVTTIVTAKFRAKGTDTVLQTIVCSKVFDNGLTGWVRMDWPATGLDVDAGRYEIEVSVSFAGEIQTANRYYMTDDEDDDDNILEIRVKEDF